MPCQTYTIKLAIADVKDDIFDSAVFFEGRSFGSNTLEVETATVSLDGTIVEGCAEGLVTFSIPNPRATNLVITYSLAGNAINGIDFERLPINVTIPAGETTASLTINAIEDGIAEGLDSVGVVVDINACEAQTFWTFIRDNQLVPPGFRLGPHDLRGRPCSIGRNLEHSFDGRT